MKIEVPYGRESLSLDLPEGRVLEVVKSEKPGRSGEERDIILEALANPVASRPLRELAGGKRSAVILASDVTRPCSSDRFLLLIVDELEAAGVTDIRVVFGLAIHRGQTEEEKVRLVGEYIAGKRAGWSIRTRENSSFSAIPAPRRRSTFAATPWDAT